MKKPLTDDELEKLKKPCKCDKCGYLMRLFPGIDCPRCRDGKMILKEYYMCAVCCHTEYTISGKNCRKCYDKNKMIKIQFYKN